MNILNVDVELFHSGHSVAMSKVGISHDLVPGVLIPAFDVCSIMANELPSICLVLEASTRSTLAFKEDMVDVP